MFSTFISLKGKRVFQTGQAFASIIAHYVFSTIVCDRNLPLFSQLHTDSFALISLCIQGSEYGKTNVNDFFYHLDCQDWIWQGWSSCESTCLPPMWPGLDSRTRRHMWIEFVGSLLCYERFSPGYSGFPLSSKTNI